MFFGGSFANFVAELSGKEQRGSPNGQQLPEAVFLILFEARTMNMQG